MKPYAAARAAQFGERPVKRAIERKRETLIIHRAPAGAPATIAAHLFS
jgi:hypothetical protein